MRSTLRIGVPIQGPAGATGATGAQGPMGPSGAQGSQGAQGIQGEPGDPGPAASNNWITVDAGTTKASWTDISSVDASGAFTALTTFTTSSAGRTIKLVTDPTTHAWTGTYQASSGICRPVSGSWTWGFRFGVAVKAVTANAYITAIAAYVDTTGSLFTDADTSKFFGVGVRNSAAVLWGDNTDHVVGAIDWDTGGTLTNNAVFTHMRDSTFDAFLSYNATNNTLSAYMAPVGQVPMKMYDYSVTTGNDAGYLAFLIYQGGGGVNQTHNVVIYGAESLSNVPGWD